MSKEQLHTLDEVKNDLLGDIGVEKRDLYEKELEFELIILNSFIKQKSMKKYILLFAVLFISAYSFATGVAVDVEQLSFIDALKENWKVLGLALIGLAEVIVKLTPTEKDNSILKKILDFLFFFIPNLKKGGGTHK